MKATYTLDENTRLNSRIIHSLNCINVFKYRLFAQNLIKSFVYAKLTPSKNPSSAPALRLQIIACVRKLHIICCVYSKLTVHMLTQNYCIP